MVNQFRKPYTRARRACLLADIQKALGLAVIITFAAFGLFATVLEAFLW